MPPQKEGHILCSINGPRRRDLENLRLRAACICFRNEYRDELLLVSSLKHPGMWNLPGGGVEEEEGYLESAVREVKEESGVEVEGVGYLGHFVNLKRQQKTYLFVSTAAHIADTWDDHFRGRERKWSPLEDVLQHFSEADHKYKLALPFLLSAIAS